MLSPDRITGIAAVIALIAGIRLSRFDWLRFVRGRWEKPSHLFDMDRLKTAPARAGLVLMGIALALFAASIVLTFIG